MSDQVSNWYRVTAKVKITTTGPKGKEKVKDEKKSFLVKATGLSEIEVVTIQKFNDFTSFPESTQITNVALADVGSILLNNDLNLCESIKVGEKRVGVLVACDYDDTAPCIWVSRVAFYGLDEISGEMKKQSQTEIYVAADDLGVASSLVEKYLGGDGTDFRILQTKEAKIDGIILDDQGFKSLSLRDNYTVPVDGGMIDENEEDNE